MDFQPQIEDATVTIVATGGQGVLVANRLIVTASHCINVTGDGSMAVADRFIEEVITKQGLRLQLVAHAVDPCADVAVLGELDDQDLVDDVQAVEQFAIAVPHVKIATSLPSRHPFDVFLFHYGEWVAAKASPLGASGLRLSADKDLTWEASGGPVVDENGNLLGVITNTRSGGTIPPFGGQCPLLFQALPVWILKAILRAQEEG
jgi:hypothetical protein